MLGANFRHSVVADFRGEFIAVGLARGLGARRNAHIYYGWRPRDVHTSRKKHRHVVESAAQSCFPNRPGTLSQGPHTHAHTRTASRRRRLRRSRRRKRNATRAGTQHLTRQHSCGRPRKRHVGDEAESAVGVRLDLFGLLASTTSLRSRFFFLLAGFRRGGPRSFFFYADSPK
ncbi:hypothetical protein HPB48_021418 [Haemaphysalis longicornis]|uniref:Uncharacterized protein n=1 Tax=Haemaphysalis longicornis TaxID=44386 RepID=A0A9J6FRK0_HAELO|nr:hypothetical protein HPB48_021418 [Haemaphysalis longicornis]